MSKTAKKPRTRAVPTHRSFRITKKRFTHPKPLPTLISLFRETGKLLGNNKKLFLGIVVVQAVLSLLFVQGISGTTNLNELKGEIQDTLGGGVSTSEQIGTGFTLFAYLASSTSTSTGGAAGVYQFFLAVIISLAVIWAVRQLLAGEKPRLKESFYKSTYPVIPFMLVLFVVGLQLLPALFGNLLYSTVISSGLAVTGVERILWLVVTLLLVLLSLYMLASSLFAVYIVTLPEMTPMKALRSARQLVLHRRFRVMLRVVALPLFLLCVALLLFVPALIVATSLAQPLFLIFSSLAFVTTHVYMYQLYRGLL